MEKSYLKYDEFFKSTTKRFFELLECDVITEYEIFKLPKKVDIVIVKSTGKEFEFFNFFREYNLISFKSERDKATIKDFRDLFIYLHGFCNMEKNANLSNTVMVMITPKIPKNLLREVGEDFIICREGVWKLKVKSFYMYMIEIDKLEDYNIETEYLYLFSEREKLREGLLKLKEVESSSKKLLDFLWKRYYIRYSNFEGIIEEELKMPKVYEADITDLVAPYIEKWKRQGREEGRQEGIKEGLKEGKEQGIKQGKKEGIKEGEKKAKIEVARKMLKEGISIDVVLKVTGLKRKELKKYKIIS